MTGDAWHIRRWYSRANLQRVGFDPDKETVTGQPVWITQGSEAGKSLQTSRRTVNG